MLRATTLNLKVNAHNFGNFSTFAQLLDCVRMLHVVHRHSIDHNHSVIFPGEEHEPQFIGKSNLIPAKRKTNHLPIMGQILTAAGLQLGLLSAHQR